MRIIILTHTQERHYYLCNSIIEKTGDVVGVITGAKVINRGKKEKFKNKIKYLKYYLKNRILNSLFIQYGKKLLKEKKLAEEKFFAGQKKHFYANHKDILLGRVTDKYRSINDEYFVSLIRQNRPDIIIVMGTCLIGQEIISSAKFVINMHTGLSPYYRGGNTNLWPFITKEIGYFGVTVHLLSLGIDSGNIIFTKRPLLNRNDNYGTINSKSIILGVNLMVKAIKLIKEEKLNSIEQWSEGRLFFDRDWNSYLAYKYFQTKKKFLTLYCDAQKRHSLPKLKLIENGVVI